MRNSNHTGCHFYYIWWVEAEVWQSPLGRLICRWEHRTEQTLFVVCCFHNKTTNAAGSDPATCLGKFFNQHRKMFKEIKCPMFLHTIILNHVTNKQWYTHRCERNSELSFTICKELQKEHKIEWNKQCGFSRALCSDFQSAGGGRESDITAQNLANTSARGKVSVTCYRSCGFVCP
jgi:hypothetical protein